MSVKLSDEQRENLTLLATYLENLPDNYDHFNMSSYIIELDIDNNYVLLNHYARHNGGVHTCGTAACAVGHGPAAGIYFNDDEFESWGDIDNVTKYQPDWDKYAERFVNLPTGAEICHINRQISSYAFDFLFSGYWSKWDDTHQGAARRIRYFLANGVPEEFIDKNRKLNFNAATEVVNAYFKEHA